MSSGYGFQSTRFDLEPGKDTETNPGVFGRQLAKWLKRNRWLGKNAALDVARAKRDADLKEILEAEPGIQLTAEP